MIDGTDITNARKEASNRTYVSCIKIAGVSLLPPILTTTRRIELEDDKQKAIEIEKRLGFQRDLQKFFKQYKLADSPHFGTQPCDKILDDLLFDNDILHINALNIISPTIRNHIEKNVSSNIVLLLDENQSSFNSEPNHRKVCDDGEISDMEEVVKKLSASTVELDLTDSTVKCKVSASTQKSDQIEYALLRSKTFVLPAPSPILLKHLIERPHTSPAFYKKVPEALELDFTPTLSDHKAHINYSKVSAISSTNLQETNDTSILSQATLTETDSKNTSFPSGCDCHLASSTLNKDENTTMPEILSSNPKEHLVTLQHTINVDVQTIVTADNISSLSDSLSLSDSSIEDDNQNTIAQFNLDTDLLLSVGNEYIRETDDENDKSLFLESQSLVLNNNDQLSTSTIDLIDFESDNGDIEAVTSSKDVETYTDAVNDVRSLNYPHVGVISNALLYMPDKAHRRVREQWAAGVLTAAAKGFLVRRLKRTERVQNLIQTIRDALLCALSLHTESSELIQNSDVELHRRLIQQVSAACYEFYEVFFSLTTKEKMDLIAIDRQRIQDKLKRPKSSINLKSDSNRSTPKSQRQSFSARQKKSLTPLFAT